jgi:hypothetical protein
VLACLAEGLGIRATALVFEVDPNTVLQWLVEAAGQLTAFTRDFLCDVHVNQLQLDELYAVLRNVKDGEFSEDDASNSRRADRSRVVPERRDALSGAAVGAASCSIRDWQG